MRGVATVGMAIGAIAAAFAYVRWHAPVPPPPAPLVRPPPLPPRPVPAGLFPVRTRPPLHDTGRGVDAYFERPEAEVDVAAGALLLAREDDGTLDVSATLARLDAWASELSAVVRAGRDPAEAAARFLAGCFGAGGLAFDAADPEARDPAGWAFHRVLERRLGVCLGLALVAQAIADRVGVPAEAVALPNHVFLRVATGPDAWQNVELTAGGAARTDAQLRAAHAYPPASEGRAYLVPVGRRGLLGMACVNRAAWHLDHERPDAALRDATRAVRLAPGLPAAHANLAAALGALHRGPESEAAADRALVLHPGMVGALRCRGIARLAQGKSEAALADFVEGLAADPLDADARLGAGRARLALRDWAAAAADLEAVVAARPDAAGARRSLAEARLRGGDPAGALEVLAPVLGHGLADPENYLLAADAAAAVPDLERAGRYYEMVQLIMPADPRGPRGRGLAALRLGRRDDALVHLAAAAERGADDLDLHLALGALYRDESRDEAKAATHWRRYVALGGDRADVRDWLAARASRGDAR